MIAHTVTHMIYETAFFPWNAGLLFSQTMISSSFMSLPHHYADIISSLCVALLKLGPGGIHRADDGVLIREALHEYYRYGVVRMSMA